MKKVLVATIFTALAFLVVGAEIVCAEPSDGNRPQIQYYRGPQGMTPPDARMHRPPNGPYPGRRPFDYRPEFRPRPFDHRPIVRPRPYDYRPPIGPRPFMHRPPYGPRPRRPGWYGPVPYTENNYYYRNNPIEDVMVYLMYKVIDRMDYVE